MQPIHQIQEVTINGVDCTVRTASSRDHLLKGCFKYVVRRADFSFVCEGWAWGSREEAVKEAIAHASEKIQPVPAP